MNRTGARSHRARKGEGGLLRDRILDATEALLAERGSMEAVSIRVIAARVGVTPPAIYLHFPDKDRLFYAVCRRGFEEMAGRLEPILASPGSARERLRAMGRAFFEYGLENPHQYRILFDGSPPASLPEGELDGDPGRRVYAGLLGLVAEAQRAGDVRADLDPAALASAMWAAVHGGVLLLTGARQGMRSEGVPAEPVMIEAILDVMDRGIEGVGRGQLPA